MYDIINAMFEFAGAYFTWKNFFTLRQQQEIRGVYFPTWIFFTSWGVWNLIFYPAVGAIWSAVAGLALVAGNVAWCVIAVKIILREGVEAIAERDTLAARPEESAVPYIHEDDVREVLSPAVNEGDCRLDECETKVFFRYGAKPTFSEADVERALAQDIADHTNYENGRQT